MTLDQLAVALDRADCMSAAAVFLYDPRCLLVMSGETHLGMRWRKFRVAGRMKIQFWFENDDPTAYTHDFDT